MKVKLFKHEEMKSMKKLAIAGVLSLVVFVACATTKLFTINQFNRDVDICETMRRLMNRGASLEEIFHAFNGLVDSYTYEESEHAGERKWKHIRKHAERFISEFRTSAGDLQEIEAFTRKVLRPMYRDIEVGDGQQHPSAETLKRAITVTRTVFENWDHIRGRFIDDECNEDRCLIFHGYRDIFPLPCFDHFYEEIPEPWSGGSRLDIPHGTAHLISFLYRRGMELDRSIISIYINMLEYIERSR